MGTVDTAIIYPAQIHNPLRYLLRFFGFSFLPGRHGSLRIELLMQRLHELAHVCEVHLPQHHPILVQFRQHLKKNRHSRLRRAEVDHVDAVGEEAAVDGARDVRVCVHHLGRCGDVLRDLARVAVVRQETQPAQLDLPIDYSFVRDLVEPPELDLLAETVGDRVPGK